MPRQRMIKVEFFDSETLAQCSHTARLLFIGLWVMGDDYGNIKAQLRKINLQVFPYDDLDDAQIAQALCELEKAGCIKGYEVDGEHYINIPNFDVYQNVRKPSKSTIPEPPKDTQKVASTALVQTWYSTSDAPVQHYGGTSDVLVQHQNSVTWENENRAALVQHYDSTSDALKKQTGREEEFLYLRNSSSSQVEGSHDGGAGAGGEDPAPRTANDFAAVFDEVDEQYPDSPKTQKAIAATLEHRRQHDELVAGATPCPADILAQVQGVSA